MFSFHRAASSILGEHPARRVALVGRAAAIACFAWLANGCPLSDAYYVDPKADGPDKKPPAPKPDGGPAPRDDGGPAPAPQPDGGGPAGPGDPTNRTPASIELANGKTSIASSEQSTKGNSASFANDGDAATRWSASSAGTPAWWRVDLGAVHRVTRVEVDWEFPRPYGYRVEISSDDVQYAPLVDRSTSTDPTQNQFADVSTSCRYVRITVTQVTASPISWPSFWEVRVFGN